MQNAEFRKTLRVLDFKLRLLHNSTLHTPLSTLHILPLFVVCYNYFI